MIKPTKATAPGRQLMEVRDALQRLILHVDPSPSSVELSTKTLLTLVIECGFELPKPPEKLPDDWHFMGVKLVRDDTVPDGAFRLTLK